MGLRQGLGQPPKRSLHREAIQDKSSPGGEANPDGDVPPTAQKQTERWSIRSTDFRKGAVPMASAMQQAPRGGEAPRAQQTAKSKQ